jgi:hypothetical protein
MEGPGSVSIEPGFPLNATGQNCVGLEGREMWAVIYVVGIGYVAALLFVAVNNIEPNRRLALVLKLLIVFVSVAAITGRVMP